MYIEYHQRYLTWAPFPLKSVCVQNLISSFHFMNVITKKPKTFLNEFKVPGLISLQSITTTKIVWQHISCHNQRKEEKKNIIEKLVTISMQTLHTMSRNRNKTNIKLNNSRMNYVLRRYCWFMERVLND